MDRLLTYIGIVAVVLGLAPGVATAEHYTVFDNGGKPIGWVDVPDLLPGAMYYGDSMQATPAPDQSQSFIKCEDGTTLTIQPGRLDCTPVPAPR